MAINHYQFNIIQPFYEFIHIKPDIPKLKTAIDMEFKGFNFGTKLKDIIHKEGKPLSICYEKHDKFMFSGLVYKTPINHIRITILFCFINDQLCLGEYTIPLNETKGLANINPGSVADNMLKQLKKQYSIDANFKENSFYLEDSNGLLLFIDIDGFNLKIKTYGLANSSMKELLIKIFNKNADPKKNSKDELGQNTSINLL